MIKTRLQTMALALLAVLLACCAAGCLPATPTPGVPTGSVQPTDPVAGDEATVPPPTATPTAGPEQEEAEASLAGVIAPDNLQALAPRYTLSGYSIAFHPQEPVVATGELTGKLKVWSLQDGSLLRELTDLHGMVFDLAFSPDGRLLAAAFGAEAAVVDAASGERLAAIDGLGQFVQAVAFAPSGALLAVGGSGGIKVLDTASWEEIAELHGHQGGVFDLDFSADGDVLVSSGGMPDSTVIVWDAASLEIRHTLDKHGGDVHSLAIAPDSLSMVSGGVDRSVFLWDLSTGEYRRGLSGYQDIIYGLAYSPGGDLVAAGCAGAGYVMVWDVASGRAPFKLRDESGEVLLVEFSPDGSFLAESNNQHQVVLWGLAQD